MKEQKKDENQANISGSQRAGVEGLVVLNPAAGGNQEEELVSIIRSILDDHTYHLIKTKEGGSICESVSEVLAKHSYQWVAAVGGDGTVSQVGNCLVGKNIPLAIIPAGTGNVIGGALGIPEDIEGACQLLAGESDTRLIDAIRVGGQHYFLQVGVGLEAQTMKKTPSENKGKVGDLAYLWTAVKEGVDWQPHKFTLTVDGEVHELEASELVLANAADVGVLGLSWGESISMDDGVIDVVAIYAASVRDYIATITALSQDSQKDSERIITYRAHKSVQVKSEKDLPVHGDGEVLEAQWPIDAAVVPKALSVIVPKASR
jgi:diacylglycerol kinase (ATP)